MARQDDERAMAEALSGIGANIPSAEDIVVQFVQADIFKFDAAYAATGGAQ